MDKTRIDNELKKFRYIRYIGFALLGIGILGFMSMFNSIRLFDLLGARYVQIRMVVYFVLVLAGTIVERRAYLHIKNKIGKEIAEEIIGQYVYDLIYDPKAPLIEPILKRLYLALPSYDIVKASDHIRGTYKGRPIEIADIKLVERRRVDKDKTELVTVFLGPFLKVETPKKISNSLTISPNRTFVKDNIKTESVSFNKTFDIYCKNQHDAFYILTPQMMERISTFERRRQRKVHLCFAADGHLYCAIDERRDRFELKMHQKNFDAISKGFDGDIRYVLSLIDEIFDMIEGDKRSAA